MNEDLKKTLFVASVALNIVFAATYAAYKLPLLGAVRQSPTPRGPLFLQLELTPEQLKLFEGERDRFHGRLQEVGEEIKSKQIELIDLLGAASPGQNEIEKKQEEIQRLQGTVQDLVIAHFLRASSFLTPGQRARFLDLIKSRIGANMQACLPWMRSYEHGGP